MENDRLLDLGEKFYPHDAHGAALAHAAGYDYGSPETAALRRTGGHAVDIRRSYGNRLSEGQIQGYNNFHQQLGNFRDTHPDNAGVQQYNARTSDITARTADTPEFGARVHKAAAELAVTSPQNPWERNVQDAFELRDTAREHPGAVANLNSWPTQPTKTGGVKTTKPKGARLEPDAGVPNRHGIPDASARRNGQFDNMTARPDQLSLNHHAGSSIKAGLDIEAGGDSEKYVSTDETHRVKIGTFKGNMENPWGGRQVPGTRQAGHSQFGAVHDSMAEGWGVHPNQDSPMPGGQFDKLSGGGSRKATVDFRAHDIATGYATPTNLSPGLTAEKSAKTRPSGGQKYDMLEEAHGRATDYLNEHHAEHRVGGVPMMPSQAQGATWWRDRVHQNMEMGGNGKGTGLVHASGSIETGDAQGKTSFRNAKPVGQPAAAGETDQMGGYLAARRQRMDSAK
jgi:hypothetical protein